MKIDALHAPFQNKKLGAQARQSLLTEARAPLGGSNVVAAQAGPTRGQKGTRK